MRKALAILDEYVGNRLYQGPATIKEIAYNEVVSTCMHTIAARYQCSRPTVLTIAILFQSALSNGQWGRLSQYLMNMMQEDYTKALQP